MLKEDHSPIRVLQIIGNVCGGGVEAVVMNYYRHIDRTKVQFDFVIDGYEKSLLDEEIQTFGGRIYKVERYSKNVLKQIYQIYRIVKDNNYDIVHSHMNTLAVFSLFAAWLGGARIRIVHNHSTAAPGEYMRTALKYILRPFSKVFANRYAACSRLAARWMFGDIEGEKTVTIFNNAIDLDQFAYREDVRKEYRNALMIPENTYLVGHIGRFMYQKNHKFLVQIIDELVKKDRDVALLLIGDGPLRKNIAAQVHVAGLDEKVQFLGLRSDTPHLYNAMDIFVLPSWYEGLPVVGVEAQANGLPCIVSDSVSDECRLTSSLSFMSVGKTAKDWADVILRRKRVRNPQAEQELTAAGFDIKSEAYRLQDYYERLSGRVSVVPE
ncbi:glycosyltransferase family 1 protein [uncultured Selenomonas sp.]|uniref:glycosyltransferase family 1 protein n=1 Tax=uncultured Selenomonas sp. TaxID=159275 RepID=UPI0028E68F1E|nr:glycosyltransferase family 1 protein [uncultured Selenomonas sp.]